MKSTTKILLINILIIISYFNSFAQTDKEFWFCVPQLTEQHETDVPELFLTNAGDEDAHVKIEMPKEPGFTTQNITVPGNSQVSYKFTSYVNNGHGDDNIIESGLATGVKNGKVTYESCTPTNKGIHITSDNNITAYLQRGNTNNCDIWALKGKNAFGTYFIVPSEEIGNCNEVHSSRMKAESKTSPGAWNAIDIVAVENCKVTVTLQAAGLVTHWPNSGKTATFTLERGQTLNLQAAQQVDIVNNNNSPYKSYKPKNLAGTIIKCPTGKIVVQWKDDSLLAKWVNEKKLTNADGTKTTEGGQGTSWDAAGDQIIPVELAGTEYIVMRGQLGDDYVTSGTANRMYENVYFMATDKGNTKVEFITDEGEVLPSQTLNGIGSWSKLLLNAYNMTKYSNQKNYNAVYIKSNKPIIVWHISGSSGAEVGGAILPRINSCTGSRDVTVCRSNTSSFAFWLNIMCKKAHIGDFKLKIQGSNTIYTIPEDYFAPIGETGWYYLKRNHMKFSSADGTRPAVGNGKTIRVWNETGLFHLAVINGDNSGSCQYGYFSNFASDASGAFVNSEDFVSDYSPFCYGETITLKAAGGYKYLWEYTQGPALGYDTTFVSDKIHDTASVHPPTGDNIYSVTIWRTCYLTKVDTTINVWAYGYPEIKSKFKLTPIDSCSPKAVVLDNQSIGGSLYSWKLDKNDGSEPTVVSMSEDYGKDTIYYTNSTASKATYTLSLETSRGYNCPDKSSKNVVVCPTVAVTLNADVVKGCQPLTVKFTGTFSESCDKAILDFGDGSEKIVVEGRANVQQWLTQGNPETHVYKNNSTDPVAFTATLTGYYLDENGSDLGDGIRGCSDSQTVDIQVWGIVKALYSIDKATSCSPLEVNFTNFSIGDDTYTKYTWSGLGSPDNPSAIPAANSSKANFTLTYTNNGSAPIQYSGLKLTAVRTNPDASTCTDDSDNNDVLTINPHFEVSYTAAPNAVCNPGDVTFTNTSNDKTDGTQFKWHLGDGTGNGSTMQNSNGSFTHTYEHFLPDYQYYQTSLAGESKWGCKDSVAGPVITVAPYINPNFTVDKTSGCSPLTIHVVNNTPAHASKAYGTWTYSQNPTQGAVQVSNQADLTFVNQTGAAQTIRITLTDNVGTCTKEYYQDIVVYPEISVAFTADDAAVCDSTAVKFTNSTVYTGQSTTPSNYQWSFGDGGTMATTSNTQIEHIFRNLNETSGTTAAKYTVTLTATANGCPYTATKEISVYPKVKAVFSSDNYKVCAPTTVIINNSSTGADRYTWSFSDGTAEKTSSNLNPIGYAITNTGDQVQAKLVTLTAYNSQKATCNARLSKSYYAYPTITPSVAVSPASGCGPLKTTVTQSVTSPSVHYTYKLNFGDNESDETGHNSINHTFRGENKADVTGVDKTYTITATFTNDLGCSATASTNVTVYPEITAEFIYEKTTECSPMDVNMVNSSTNGTQFNWTFGDGGSESMSSKAAFAHRYANSSADGNSISTYQIKMVAIDAHHPACRDSITKNIDIYPQVIAAFSTANDVGCSPLTTTFTNNSKGYGLTYLWDYAHDYAQSADANSSHTHTFDNLEASTHTYNITLTTTDINNCTSTTTMPVKAHPHVTANFAFVKNDACTPYPVTFSYPAAINGNKFEWDFGFGGNKAVKTNMQNFDFTFDNTELNTVNNYTIKLTSTDTITGCSDNTQQNIEVYPRLRPKFTPDTTSGCDPLTVNFSNQTTGLAEYLWDFGDSQFANETNPAHVFNHYETSDQTYTVSLRTTQTATGCVKTVDTTVTAFSYVLAKFGLTEVSENANGGAAAVLGGCTPFEVMLTDSSRNISNGSWSWDFGDGNTSTTRQPSSRTYTNDCNTAPLENKNYTIGLTVTNLHGCENKTQQTIVVYPRSVPNFTANFEGCEPLTVNFVDSSIVDAGSHYYWTFSDGATSVGEPPFSKTFHNYSYTDNLKFTANLKTTTSYNCTDEITKEITVYPKPLANFLPLIDRACPPFEAEFVNNSKGTGLTYYWDFDNGVKYPTTSTANQKVSYSNDTDEPITRNVELIIESDHACRDTMVNPMITFPNVVVDFSFDTAGCSPHTIEIDNKSTKTTAYHLWNFGEGSTSVAAEPTFTYFNTTDNDQVLTITYIGTSKYQCSDTISKNVTVYINPNVDFVAHTPSQRYPDDTVYFENYTQDGPWSYNWEFGDGNKLKTDEKYFMYKYGQWGKNSENNIFHVTLHVETEHCENTMTHDVTILPPYPKIEILNQKPAGCVPLTVDFRIKEEYCNTYQWEFEDGATSTEAEPSHTFTEPGIYNVKLTAEGDGGSHYDYEIITVYELPTPDFVATPTFVMLPNQAVQFFNSSLNGNTYIWDFGDGTYTTDLNPVHYYTQEGIYDVKLIAYSQQMCVDSVIKMQAIEVSGAGEIRFPNAFIATAESPADGSYPVPDDVNNVFHPKWHGVKEYDLWIFNRWGEQLFHSSDVNVGWNGKYNNDGKDLGQDVYFWKAKGKFQNGTPFKIAGDVTLIRK
ncbi:MAG: PKD domain-containing protein [Salinivirgaceae bacterium]|nr:PKD domain-containing protein [Salinivirgaceae bacterium]